MLRVIHRTSLGLHVVLCLALAVPATALGQGLFEEATAGAEEDAAADGSSSPGALAVELGGYVRGDLYAGKQPEEDAADLKNGYGEVALSLRARKGRWGDGYGEVRFWQGNDMGTSEGRFAVREAYVNAWLGPIDLRVGHQIIVWGRADGINPTNNLTPVDMRVRSPNEDDKRIGNLAVRASLFLEPLRFEAIWVPLYAPSHLPDIQFGEVLEFASPENPDRDVLNGTLAARINLEAAAVDGSLSYLFGYAPLPGVTFKELALEGATPTVSVAFRPYRQHVAGMDFSTALGDWFGMRGEAAYKHPVEEDEPDYEPLPEVHWVLGADKQIGVFTGIVQYVGKFVVDWESLPDYGIDLASGEVDMAALAAVEGGPMAVLNTEVTRKNRMIRGQLHEWSHLVMTRLAWSVLYETLDLEVMGTWDFATEEWLARAVAAYDLADALTLTVGGEVWGGPDGTLYGTIDELMSAGFVELKASF